MSIKSASLPSRSILVARTPREPFLAWITSIDPGSKRDCLRRRSRAAAACLLVLYGCSPKIVERPKTPARPAEATKPPADPAVPTIQAVIPLEQDGGNIVVPVRINEAIDLKFALDSGAADVTIPADVVSTLVRSGTITRDDFIGGKSFTLADGSTLPSVEFRVRSLRVGSLEVRNVTASLGNANGSLVLGRAFLVRLSSWSIDNQKRALILTASQAGVDAPTPSAAAPLAVHRVPDSRPRLPAETEIAQVEQDVLSKTEALYKAWSARDDPDGDAVAQYYAPQVNFYGSIMPVAVVMRKNLQFCRRWPVRRYVVRRSSQTVSCSSPTYCVVNGVLDWEAESVTRAARSSGVAQFTLGIRDGLIEMVNGSVLSRSTASLSP